jgi:hypothetical protein
MALFLFNVRIRKVFVLKEFGTWNFYEAQ